MCKSVTIMVSELKPTQLKEMRDIMKSFVKAIIDDLATCAKMIDVIVAKGQL